MLTCLIEQFSDVAPDTRSTWFHAFSERYHVNVRLTCIPTLDFADRFAYLLSAGDLPALVTTNNTVTQSGIFKTAVQTGCFWDLTDILPDYPHLMAYLGEDALRNALIEGRLYGIPRLRSLTRNGMIYRKDWAERLGLDPPQTLSELHEMIRAFTEDDPDGNGLHHRGPVLEHH